MKRNKFKSDYNLKERQMMIETVLDLLEANKLTGPKVKKMSLPEFYKFVYNLQGEDTSSSTVVKVYDMYKSGEIF